MPEYTITTVATHKPVQDYYCLDAYFKSLRGEPILILDREYTKYAGLMSKPKGLYRAIKEKLIDTKYIIFTDCFDFVFTEAPEVLFEVYKNFHSPIVISSEKNCFPNDLKDEFDKLDSMGSSYKYLNSGMIVGETEAILSCLETMDLTDGSNDHWDAEKKIQVNPNDQFEWMKVFIKQVVPIELDYGQLLCNTLHSVEKDELDFNEFGIFNKECGCIPLSFHANGNAKTSGVLPLILKHLNLL